MLKYVCVALYECLCTFDPDDVHVFIQFHVFNDHYEASKEM